jgi:hypothetical protein
MHHISGTSILLLKGITTIPVKFLNILDHILLYSIRINYVELFRSKDGSPTVHSGTGEIDVQFEQAVIAFLVEGKKLTCVCECLIKVGAAVTVDVSTIW